VVCDTIELLHKFSLGRLRIEELFVCFAYT